MARKPKPRDYDEDTAPLSVQPSVGSIVPLSEEPTKAKQKPKPIGFVQFKEAKDGKRNLR